LRIRGITTYQVTRTTSRTTSGRPTFFRRLGLALDQSCRALSDPSLQLSPHLADLQVGVGPSEKFAGLEIMNGRELLAALRNNPTTSLIPVIFLSAQAGAEARVAVRGLDDGEGLCQDLADEGAQLGIVVDDETNR
jgi:CheY-like chemotaxis protein